MSKGKKGDAYQVVYVDGDVPQLPIQLGQLLVDSSQISPGTTNLQQCTSQDPLTYEPLQGGYPPSAMEIAAGVTIVNDLYYYGQIERYGGVFDGIDGTDTGTDNTVALQAALDSNYIVILPAGCGLYHSATIPLGRTIRGQSRGATILRQFSTETDAALTFEDVLSADISVGSVKLEDFCLKVAIGANGIDVGEVAASMFETNMFRLWSQEQELLVNKPYPTEPGQIGIRLRPNFVGPVFFHNHRNLEIRSFDVGIEASGVVNEVQLNAWIIDCRLAIVVSDVSTWNLTETTVESGVANAVALDATGAVSNIVWNGGRWELTWTGGTGIVGNVTDSRGWRFSGINVLIDGDGGGIPGSKWSGTVPDDFIFTGTDVLDGTEKPFSVIPNQVRMLMPNLVQMGGQNLGTGKITLGRDAGGGEAYLENVAAGRAVLTGANSVDLQVNGVLTARVDDNSTAGNTRFLLYDVDNGTMERVSVGAADSGGAGFKLLRIPN